MGYTVLIPARLAATRLPNKPLADIGGRPMIVRVADQAALSGATSVVVATDSPRVQAACEAHNHRALLTRADHPSGSDRLAEAAAQLGLRDEEIVVNVQGDEPLIVPDLIDAVASCLRQRPQAAMSTAAHAIGSLEDYLNPNVVKVVTDAQGLALYFSRAPIAWWRDGWQGAAGGFAALPGDPAPLRHVGIYAYRVGFLRQFPQLPPAPMEHCEALEQLRALWHGHRIAVHVTSEAPGTGVDTPQDLERVRRVFAGRS